ncbi:unnamed protein product, partial [Bubo scandiacus]
MKKGKAGRGKERTEGTERGEEPVCRAGGGVRSAQLAPHGQELLPLPGWGCNSHQNPLALTRIGTPAMGNSRENTPRKMRRNVCQRLMDVERDLVFLCFPEQRAIWDAVAGYIQEQLLLRKGVRIPALGCFDVVSRQIQVGEEAVTIPRPVFRLARNLVVVRNLSDNKAYLPGNKELEPLKYSKVAAAASVSRQKAEGCIQGTMSLLSYCLGKGENVTFVLRDIGVLLIEGTTVQMKLYYDFLEMLSGKENLEQVIFKVPQLLDMVVPRMVPVASLSFSGHVIIFPELEMEFVHKPPLRALLKTWRQVPGKVEQTRREFLPPLGQEAKVRMEPAVAVVLRLMSLGEVQFSGKGRTSINFFKSSWSNKPSPPAETSLPLCPSRQQPVILGDSSGEKQPGTGQAKGKAALKDRASKQSRARAQAATAQSRWGGEGGRGEGRRGQGMVEKMLAGAKPRKAKRSPPQEASWSPREVVRSLLVISPTCDSAAMAMWEVMISVPWALWRVVSELLGVLRDWRLRRVFSSAVEDACIYPLALLVSAVIDDKQFAALYKTQRYLRRPSPVMLSLVLAGLTTLSKTPETARKMPVLLPDIMENLPAANSDIRMKALMLFINVIPHMKREEAKLITLRLAEKLLLLFDDESSRVRELSIRLFKDVMKTAVGRNTKKMVKKVQGAVLPLFFHTNEKIESVAKASWDTLRACAEFLGWRRLSFLAETGQTPLIRECLITHKRNSADEYLLQSLLYVENPQASVREAAVRFIERESRLLIPQRHQLEKLRGGQRKSMDLRVPTEPLLSLLLLQTMAVFITRILTLLSIAQYVLRVGDQEDAATQELLRQREEQERQEMTWLLESSHAALCRLDTAFRTILHQPEGQSRVFLSPFGSRRISHRTNGFTGRDWVTLIINVPGSCGDIYLPAYLQCLLQHTGTEKSLSFPREIPFGARLATFLGVTRKLKPGHCCSRLKLLWECGRERETGEQTLQVSAEWRRGSLDAAMAMWEVMISVPWALWRVVSELLGVLRDWRLRRVFSSAVEDACIYPLARYLRRPSPVMLSLVLAGLTTLSKTPETARKMPVLLPDIMENLPAANSDIRMKALMLFINVIPHMKREEAKLITLRLAEKLLLLFDDESSRVRELSIRLFKDVMKTAVGRNTKKMVKKVQGAVLPLFFHTNEKIESVAKVRDQRLFSGPAGAGAAGTLPLGWGDPTDPSSSAAGGKEAGGASASPQASWDTLRACAEFLGWRRLSFLAETGQTPLIRECLITHKRNSADEYLLQSLLYVENPQASVREAAVRFIGLAARRWRILRLEKLWEICHTLQSLENDAEHSIRSLAAQTVLILTALKQKPRSGWSLRSLWCC